MPLDALILAGLGPFRNSVWDALALFASIFFLVFAAAGPVIVYAKGARRAAYGLGTGLVLSGTAAVFFQVLLQRPRPVAHLIPAISGLPGFPSGHAALAFASAVFIALWSRRSAAWLFAGALVVAASRVYLGHHYPSDVLGGAMLGAGLGAFAYGLTCRQPSRPRWAYALWPAMGLVAFALLGAYAKLLPLPWISSLGVDKVMHFVLFGALAFFGAPWVQRDKKSAWTALFVLAAAEEFLQAYAPSRTFDVGDLVCTLSGILVGGLASQAILRRTAEEPKPVTDERAAVTS